MADQLPSTVGRYKGKVYSFGFYDVALTMFTRKSVLQKYGIRIPTLDKPWTKDEFAAALAKIKAGGTCKNALDMGTGGTGEWWPYAYSPQLQSFGGDLIDRSTYKTADGVLNGKSAVAWGTWFRSLVTQGYMPQKSGASPNNDFLNGKSAIEWDGSWDAATNYKKFGDDLVFAPGPDLGTGAKIGGASWQWGMSSTCSNKAGALAYLNFSRQTKYFVDFAKATGTLPATDAAAAQVDGAGRQVPVLLRGGPGARPPRRRPRRTGAVPRRCSAMRSRPTTCRARSRCRRGRPSLQSSALEPVEVTTAPSTARNTPPPSPWNPAGNGSSASASGTRPREADTRAGRSGTGTPRATPSTEPDAASVTNLHGRNAWPHLRHARAWVPRVTRWHAGRPL